MATAQNRPSPEKAAQIACNGLRTAELLTMLKGYIDPARKESRMVGAIFKELGKRVT